MIIEGIIMAIVVIVAIIVFLSFVPLNLWISALASGVHVSIFTLVGMRIRRVSPAKIVNPLTMEVVEEMLAPCDETVFLMIRGTMTKVHPGDYAYIMANKANAEHIVNE